MLPKEEPVMSLLRLMTSMLLVVVTMGLTADWIACGAARPGIRNNRTYRNGRPSRSNPRSGAMADVQRAVTTLYAARKEQISARRNLVQTRSVVKARHDNSKGIAQVGEEFNTVEAEHHAAQEKVRVSLETNDPAYRSVRAKLGVIEEQLKAPTSGTEIQQAALKAQARELRLAVSGVEGKAFKKDGAVQAALVELEGARRRVQTLRKATEVAIAKDSEMNRAKSQMVLASRKVSLAQAAYSRAVASANAAAQLANARALRSRYAGSGRTGRGRHHSSRFRRYR